MTEQELILRRIALKLAHQNLIDAEKERLAMAEFEATQGIQYNDIVNDNFEELLA